MKSELTRTKIASIVWTIDPEGNRRFLLRHNRPFDGYNDEWTILFGGVDEGESTKEAAIREVGEEYGIVEFQEMLDLGYKIEYQDKGHSSVIHFFAMKIASLDVPMVLNNESIGYDWITLDQAVAIMKHNDESIALGMVG